MSDFVSPEEFAKIAIVVGKVVEAERVPGSKKLVRLKIDVGSAVKQSVAGLGDQYSLENLKNMKVIVVANLKPRQIFGQLSEVMLLAAVDGTRISLIQPDKDVPTGCKVT